MSGALNVLLAGGSTAAVLSPADVFGANLIGWWKADTGVTTSSGNVTAVTDQNGNGKTLTNTGTVPFNATGFNSLPAFDFAAANNAGLSNSSFTGFGSGNTGSVFIVGQMKTGTASFGGGVTFIGDLAGDDYASAGSAAFIIRDSGNNGIVTYQGGSPVATTAISLATNYRLGAVFDGVNLTQYVNNVAGGSAANSHSWSTGVSLIGIGNRIAGGLFGGTPWDGPIAEIVVLNTAPSSGDRTSLDNYFKTRFGL